MSVCAKASACGDRRTAQMLEGNDYLKPERNVLVKTGDKHPTPCSCSLPRELQAAWGLLVGTDRVAPPPPAGCPGEGVLIRTVPCACCTPGKCKAESGTSFPLAPDERKA